ncbi:unnamed protein product [Aureobasidium vineae]|uniref:Uncharacterized protein n=1 Tax=Aureobasidium vineae TaxID=2773715 RepID=A0A9N8JY58_9PEZI|nr:unnamed protein product [Aureobasidium vineae]
MFRTLVFLPCAFAAALANPSPFSDCYEPFPYGSFPTGVPRPTGLPSGSFPGPFPFPGPSYGAPAPFPTFNVSSVVVGPTGTGVSSAFIPSSSDEGRSGSLSSSGTAFVPSSSDEGRSGSAASTPLGSTSLPFPDTPASPAESVTTIYSATTAVTTVITTVFLPAPGPESSSNVTPVASATSISNANVTTISSFVTGTVTLITTVTPPASSSDSPVTAVNSTLLPNTATSNSVGTGGFSASGNRTSSGAPFTFSPTSHSFLVLESMVAPRLRALPTRPSPHLCLTRLRLALLMLPFTSTPRSLLRCLPPAPSH